MPRINLLPWRDTDRARRRKEFALGAVGAALAAAAITLFVSWGYSAAIDGQLQRNALLKHEISELDKQIAEILGLEEQKRKLDARMEIITRLQRSRPEVVHIFDQLVRTLPEGVSLTSVKQNDKRLEIRGIAQSSTRVSTFMRNIEASPWLENPELQVVETVKTGGSGSEFTLFATQRSSDGPEAEHKPARDPSKAGVSAP
jgi:type IV pilus assembly protein PilN